ncbi:VOC family protein [Corallococcus exiguus]|uniref:VOC family protein n=1 Tax=Corallococcus exiguus TaxID=83462 RepID=UPI0020B88679|nr:VOC family protein [Corallococcus exiguus]
MASRTSPARRPSTTRRWGRSACAAPCSFPRTPGADGIGYGRDYPIFWIDRFHPHGVKQHTAFAATSRAQVDAFHSAAVAAGGADNGPPGLRGVETGYPAGYYAAFVLDPDGNNIEAVFREPSR